MHEIFFHFHVSKFRPTVTVSQNDGENILKSFSLETAEAYVTQKTTKEVIILLLGKPQIQFILEKAAIDRKELKLFDISKEDLSKKAFTIAKEMATAKFVTSMDLFASYMLLTEEKTRLLFSKQLKKEEFLQIVYWACADFPHEEIYIPKRVRFWGEGIGENWVFGWTLETKKYAVDNTAKFLSKKPIIVGREKEYTQMLSALSKPENNNVLLVGERGVGKDNMVSVFAYDSFMGNVEKNIQHHRIFELMVGPLIAGVSSKNDLEARLQSVMEEIAHAGNIILYIPEFQNVMGASSFGFDISGCLVPYLRDGKIPLIAALTSGEYKTFVEENAIREAFEVVKILEPDKKTAIQMLLEKAQEIEQKNRIVLTYKAVVTAVLFANKYLQDTVLPGSAVTLIDNTAHAVSLAKRTIVNENDVVSIVEEKTHIAVASPKEEEKELLLHLENKLHERVVDQVEAIRGISEAMRRIRTGLASSEKPISFLFLGPTGVGKTETAKSLAAMYFGGENHMLRFDMSEYEGADGIKRMLGAAAGQGQERGELTDKIHDNPFSLVLLDEFEKASPQILDLFLQVLDDGRLTDNKGRTVSFASSIIIATSNAGSEFIREEVLKKTVLDKTFHQKLLDFIQTKGIFKPELLNRFDDVIVFKPLGQEEVVAITKLLLVKLTKTLAEKDITVSFDERVIAKISSEGSDQEFGARPLQRFIQDNIEDLISKKILMDEIKRGDKINVTTNDMGVITVTSL